MKKYPFPPAGGYGELDEDDFMNTSSAADCTGLIPSGVTDDEYGNYAELYDFLPPDASRDLR